MMQSRWLITLFLLFLLAVGLLSQWPAFDTTSQEIIHDPHDGTAMENRLATSTATDANSPNIKDFIQKMAAELNDRYHQHIAKKSTQVKLIKLRDYVLGIFPDQGKDIFRQIIFMAFPDYAHDILNSIASMDQYQDWLDSNYSSLEAMSLLERNGALWEKRTELFGDDSQDIWQHELTAAAGKQQAMTEKIASLDQSFDTSIDEKLYLLGEYIGETYNNPVEIAAISKSTKAEVFFRLESVQHELAAMDTGLRQEQINHIRDQLGFSEEQIQQLEQFDKDRNARWQNGFNYLEKRAQLDKELRGESFSAELKKLQHEYFGEESYTIALEEESGFFRYERPRVYGRN